MKFAAVLLVILALPAAAQMPSPTESVIDVKDLQTCGLVTRFPGDILAPNCLQQTTNVLSDRTGVPTRRGGYSQYNGTPCPGGQAVRGLWPFFAQNGIQYLVMQSSASMFYSPGDGTCIAIPGLNGGLSLTATMECVQLNGFLYCTDGIDPVFGTNVISTVAVSQAPLGYHVGAFRNRLLVSGVPGSGASGSGSQVFLSGELNPLDFTIPAVQLTTSPAIISVNGINDGLLVRCLMGEFQNQFLIGRAYDLWGLSGYDLSDFALRKISSQVGCLEPRSVQEVTNVLYWLSYRGVEGYTGTQIQRVSYPIDSQVLPVIASALVTLTDTLTSPADWQSGNLTASGPGAPVSATISPGDLVPSTFSATYVYAPVNSSSSTITNTSAGGVTFANAGAEAGDYTNWALSTSGYCGAAPGWASTGASGSLNPKFGTKSWEGVFATAVTTAVTVNILDAASGSVLQTQTRVLSGFADWLPATFNTASLSANAIQVQAVYPSPAAGACVAGSNAVLTSTPLVRGASIAVWVGENFTNGSPHTFAVAMDMDETIPQTVSGSGSSTSTCYDTSFSTPVWGDLNTTVANSTPAFQFIYQTQVATACTGVFDALVTQSTGAPITSAAKEAIRVVSTFTYASPAANSPGNALFSSLPPNLAVTESFSAATTVYYITPCILVSTPTSYGNFLADGVTNGGTLTFWISTGATCGAAIASTATWNAQAANSVIAVTTATKYLAARVLFGVDAASQTPTLNDLTFSWNPGVGRPPTASARWDDRYLLFYTTSTAVNAVNDHAFVYDQNQKWQLWDDQYAASAALYQNNLYTGDAKASGLVYQQDVGASDNGGAFSMTFQTADLDGGDPNLLKEFSRAYLMMGAPSGNNGAATLTCVYSLDGSTSTYPVSPVILSQSPTQNGYFVAKLPFNASQPVTGHWLNLTCSYTGSVGPVAVHRIRLVYTSRGWE